MEELTAIAVGLGIAVSLSAIKKKLRQRTDRSKE